MIMVNAGHPLAQKSSVEIEELKNEMLFLPMHTYPVSRYLRGMFQSVGIPFSEDNTLSFLTAQQMAAKGLGVGFSSVYTVRTPCPELCYVPISTPHAPWKLCVCRRKDVPCSPEAQAFVDFAKEYCQQLSLHNVSVMQGECIL